MHSTSRKTRLGIALATFTGVALLACVAAPRAQADSWDKMTRLTFQEPTQVMNTYLEPGTYMFKLANSDRHIVQIFNADRSRLINTILAIPDYRTTVTSGTKITYWETPPGMARAVRSWFYPGDFYGQEFTYPANLRQVASVTPPALPAPAPAVQVAPPVVPQAEAAPAALLQTEAAPEALLQPEPAPSAGEDQQPVLIAQNTAPAQPAPAAGEPPQAGVPPEQSPEGLPHTASPYPLIGLGGLLSLGSYLALRMKQTAE